MKHLGEKDGFYGMTYRVTKVEKISKTAFTLITGYNVRLYSYRA
jgi:hypothetical protein